MSFRTIHTNAGLTAIADAQVSGTQINLTHMAVGDGNGNEVLPVATQTALVREVYRASVNRVFKPDPTNDPLRFSVELVVPSSVGGFTMREVGIFDADGTLFAVGSLPSTYKPEDGEGAFSDTVVRLDFIVESASVITLQADPNVVIATRTWVTNNITAGALIPGGTTAQVLRKRSNADGDTEWSDPTDVNVFVNTVEEVQTLAAAQTVVDLAVVNTFGVAIYIEGVRLPKAVGADGWQPDPIDITKLTLGQSYPAGTQLIAVQNEPASDLPDALRKDQNLNDLPNKATARANLDVMSRAEVEQRTPSGAVVYFARNTAPTGWLKANGAEVSRSVYSALFSAIGTTFGAGNGATTFNLPDLRGEFLRGWDDGRGVDAGRVFAGGQSYATAAPQTSNPQRILGDGKTAPLSRASHPSVAAFVRPGKSGENVSHKGTDSVNAALEIDVRNALLGDPETRPRNIALLACINF